METVFDAENNLEAHMIVHLLERSEIHAEIMGEHLQGGVGELPAYGNIRVVVEPDEASEARELIAAWEAEQRAERSTEATTKAPNRRNDIYSGLVFFLAGVGVASAFLLWAFSSPLTPYTADYNRDGETDEWVHYRGESVSMIEQDRNHDGLVDARFVYSPRNSLEKSEFDNDFDGTFEVDSKYKYAQPHTDEIDNDGDGQVDQRYQYVDGVLTQIDMFLPSSRIVKKSQIYENGISLVEARWDSDNDGVLDTVIKYGPFEEEISRTTIFSED